MYADEAFRGLSAIEVEPDEPEGANALLVGDVWSTLRAFPEDASGWKQRPYMRLVDVDELPKAEAP